MQAAAAPCLARDRRAPLWPVRQTNEFMNQSTIRPRETVRARGVRSTPAQAQPR